MLKFNNTYLILELFLAKNRMLRIFHWNLPKAEKLVMQLERLLKIYET